MSDAAQLAIFNHLFRFRCGRNGRHARTRRLQPQYRWERLDFSCAVFLTNGQLLAQAAHIPVHLGAMPASVSAAIEICSPFQPGDVVILNDPYQGGNHLPDITLVSPVLSRRHNRAWNLQRFHCQSPTTQTWVACRPVDAAVDGNLSGRPHHSTHQAGHSRAAQCSTMAVDLAQRAYTGRARRRFGCAVGSPRNG